jgi:hypothetical protein
VGRHAGVTQPSRTTYVRRRSIRTEQRQKTLDQSAADAVCQCLRVHGAGSIHSISLCRIDRETESSTRAGPSGRIRYRRLAQERRPDPSLGLMLIVRETSQFEIVACGLTAVGKRDDVMDFDEPALGAPASCSNERTLPAVPSPDRTSHRRGYVPRAWM